MTHNQKTHTYVCYTGKLSARWRVLLCEMEISGGERGGHFYDL